MTHLQASLAAHGLLVCADHEAVADGWPRALATFQRCGVEETRQIGLLRRVTLRDIECNHRLQRELFTTYRNVFGGEEWREWVRCTRPGCGRYYGKQEVLELQPRGMCECGWHEPLVPFHTLESVLTKLRRELADEVSSCCHVRNDLDGKVEGFSWGYMTTLPKLLDTLLPAPDERARATLSTGLVAWYNERGLIDMNAPIYYHSELGVMEHVRGLALGCAFFHRAMQFAYDQGVETVIIRSSPRTNASPICFGLGMQVLYRYDEPYDDGIDKWDVFPAADDDSPDGRIVLAGDVRRLLQVFSKESDRRLAVHIGRRLRMGRGRGVVA